MGRRILVSPVRYDRCYIVCEYRRKCQNGGMMMEEMWRMIILRCKSYEDQARIERMLSVDDDER